MTLPIIENKKHLLNEEESYEFCEDTKKLARGLKTGFILLAERLHRISKQKLYKPTYEHFYEYCDEIEMREDTASRLVNIYETFVLQHKMPIEEIKEVDYSKLYIIKKVADTKETARHWVEEAKVLTYRDLKKRVAEFTTGVDQMTCSHGNTYLVRCCRECGEKWEEYGEQTVTVHKDEIIKIIDQAKSGAILTQKDTEDFVKGIEWLENMLVNNLNL